MASAPQPPAEQPRAAGDANVFQIATGPTPLARALRRPAPPRVVVVGGGLAGLACAAGLVDRDVAITLCESRPRLGGRASSFPDPKTGELVDNCQHVSMSCCTNLADFCHRVEIADLFTVEKEIHFVDHDGRLSTWKAGWLPAPFHLMGALLSSRFLTLGDKLRIARGMVALRFAKASNMRSFEDWLRAHGQSSRVINRFWGTVLVSALNERLDRLDIGHARKVFLDGMLRNRTGHQIELPRVPLGELYGIRLETWLSRHAVDVRLNCAARRLEFDDEGAVTAVVLRNGDRIAADFVVLAVPFARAAELIPESSHARLPGIDAWSNLPVSPITSIHLWFDRHVCPVAHAVILDRTIQWVFNHSALQGRHASDGTGQYLQLVVSAAHEFAPLDKAAILQIAMADLSAIWPAARDARVLRSWVVTEHEATFSARPGIDALRPDQRTPIEGLFLAGDWTNTGWPATMEGAVRSGYRAAEGITEDLGVPKRIIQAELPQGRLARLLLGRRQPTPHPTRPFVPLVVHAVAAGEQTAGNPLA